MRVDGKPEGLRQSMSWLHTWSGLLLGWLLYAVFFTGTLSFFRDEINDWMRPELHGSVQGPETARRALATMQRLAPEATTWTLGLPGPRQVAVEASWRDKGAAQGRAGTQRAELDAATGEKLAPRETRGGNFFYRFHFELHAMPRIWGRWIVGFATMMMFVAIISGVITHKKIFTDFFTLRPRKGQRSWLDAHNATAVLALPFHIVITFSGLVLLMFILMPWGVQGAYNGDTNAYFADVRASRGLPAAQGQGGREGARPAAGSAPLADIEPMMAEAARRWPEHGVGSIIVSAPGTARATIELREGGAESLANRGLPDSLLFDGVTGQLRERPEAAPLSWVRATGNVVTGLHLGRFAEPAVRWLLLLSGLVGTFMAGSGMVLWVVKRLPERRKLGRTPFGHRLVEVLNVGAIAGLSVAVAGFFWLNRLLPAQMAGRQEGEINGFLLVWLLCLVHALVVSHRNAWRHQMALATLMFALLPVLNGVTGGSALPHSLLAGQWSVASFDLLLLGLAAIHGTVAWWLWRARPAAAAQKAAPTPKPAVAAGPLEGAS
jgi:uncharacterized iron-regulated membrane protein